MSHWLSQSHLPLHLPVGCHTCRQPVVRWASSDGLSAHKVESELVGPFPFPAPRAAYRNNISRGAFLFKEERDGFLEPVGRGKCRSLRRVVSDGLSVREVACEWRDVCDECGSSFRRAVESAGGRGVERSAASLNVTSLSCGAELQYPPVGRRKCRPFRRVADDGLSVRKVAGAYEVRAPTQSSKPAGFLLIKQRFEACLEKISFRFVKTRHRGHKESYNVPRFLHV